MYVRIALRPPLGAITSHNCAELARNSSEFPGLTYTNEETRRTELASSVAYLLESTIHEGFGGCTQGTRKRGGAAWGNPAVEGNGNSYN